jgi:hypothetical protein
VFEVPSTLASKLPPEALLRASISAACAKGLTAGQFRSFLSRVGVQRIDRRRHPSAVAAVAEDECLPAEHDERDIYVPEANLTDPYRVFCETSEAVIIGSVTSTSSFEDARPNGSGRTVTQVEIVTELNIRGIAQPAWTVHVSGGKSDTGWTRVAHAAKLEIGQRYLLFLRSTAPGVSDVVGGENGAWILPPGASIEDAAVSALVSAFCD